MSVLNQVLQAEERYADQLGGKVHHSDGGMALFTDDIISGLLARSLQTTTVYAQGWHHTGDGLGSPEGRCITWLTFKDNAASVLEDVHRIRQHPLVPKSIPIYGCIYDVKTGHLIEVPEAQAARRSEN